MCILMNWCKTVMIVVIQACSSRGYCYIPSSHMVAHICLSLQVQGIQHAFLDSMGAVSTQYTYIHTRKTKAKNHFEKHDTLSHRLKVSPLYLLPLLQTHFLAFPIFFCFIV